MNGVHDMGGMHGFGPVREEPNEPVFHDKWEGRVYAMSRVTGLAGLWNIDMMRASQEMLPPQVYLSSSYYERWERGLEQLLLKHGLVTAEEIAAGHARAPAKPVNSSIPPSQASKLFTRPSYARPAPAPARFKPGDRVRARNINPATHTRLPALCARARRHGRSVAWLSRVSGRGRRGPRRGSALALHCRV